MLQPETRRDIVVNGKRIATSATTLAELVAEQGLSNIPVATALNGDFVPVAQRASTQVAEGDRVELVSARQGG